MDWKVERIYRKMLGHLGTYNFAHTIKCQKDRLDQPYLDHKKILDHIKEIEEFVNAIGGLE